MRLALGLEPERHVRLNSRPVCSFCSCLRHGLCMPPEFILLHLCAVQLGKGNGRSSAPPPLLLRRPPTPQLVGRDPAAGGLLGPSCRGLRGGGLGRRGGGGAFAAPSRPEQPPYTRPPPFTASIRLQRGSSRATSSTTAHKMVVLDLSDARWCVLCRL